MPTEWRDYRCDAQAAKGKVTRWQCYDSGPAHSILRLRQVNISPAGSSVSSSRSNYLDLHLEAGKGKRFLFYASLGSRISNTIQMSLKGLTIELKIATICSNWKYDHHFLWSSDLGMSKGHSTTASKEAAGERWNLPTVGCCTFFPISHFPESTSHRAALLFMVVLVQFQDSLLSSKPSS